MSDSAPDENTETLPPAEAPEQALAAERDFVRFEKNLSAIGFFSASNTHQGIPKTVTVTRNEDGRRLRASITISPSMPWGLPTVAHQDKTFAFFKIIQYRQQAGEKIENPITFHSSDLLRQLDLRIRTGKNYEDVYRWLDVMTFTGIKSEAALYLAGQKQYGTDRYHVFTRSVSHGRQLGDGTVADRNYVWLSDWMLENLRNGYLVAMDFDAYKQLRNPIAKVLVPLLQVWLYASEEEGVFTKRYAEFCQQVGISEYHHLSKIQEKLAPALDELEGKGYLATWQIEKGAEGYKLTLRPGRKYFEDRTALRDRRASEGLPRAVRPMGEKTRDLPPLSPAPPVPRPQPRRASSPETEALLPGPSVADAELVGALIGQGLAEDVAAQLAADKPEECQRQLDYLPFQRITGSRAGFLRRAIETPGGYGIPAGYEERQRKQAQAEQQNALQSAQDARRGAVVTELVQLVEVMINDDTQDISDFLEFFKAERARDLRKFPRGGRLYQVMVEAYDSEQKQLELLVTHYAQHPCPLAALNAFIEQHTPVRLKKYLKEYFSSSRPQR
jgi:hypothetical protein